MIDTFFNSLMRRRRLPTGRRFADDLWRSPWELESRCYVGVERCFVIATLRDR
ncbi:MAG TPA: hypothetical protein VL463_15160 [Kofleriaceae bacterium]|jgi:hypothetical protein|nr:hypothetical protein [Kofleriaceae bacterium]